MATRVFALAGVLGMLAVALGDEAVPLPTRKSIILSKEGTVYYVEGRQTIPWGCEISAQKDIHIVGRGSGAVLVVEGSLQAHGVDGREIIFEGLTVEPAARCEDIQLDMVIFRKGGGVRTAKGKPIKGKIFIENATFHDTASIDLHLYAGEVDLLDVSSYAQVRVEGVPAAGKTVSELKFKTIGGNYSGGLFLTGARDATVRINVLGGTTSEFVDCRKLTFDGNKVRSQTLLFRQTRAGRFSKTKLQKCDIYSDRVVFDAPVAKRKERCSIDKCWFRGLTKAREIQEKVIHDARRNPKSGVTAVFRKIKKKPLELAGPVDR